MAEFWLPPADFFVEEPPGATGVVLFIAWNPFSLSRSVKSRVYFLLYSPPGLFNYTVACHVQGDGRCRLDRGWLLLRLCGGAV